MNAFPGARGFYRLFAVGCGAAVALALPARVSPAPVTATHTSLRKRVNEKDGQPMLLVPRAQFLMGEDQKEIDAQWKRFGWPASVKAGVRDEVPRHRVRMTHVFWLATTPVTVAQFRRYCDRSGHTFPEQPEWNRQDAQPVVNVTWEEARDYCRWAGGRLPTEAEWELAARGEATGVAGKPRHIFAWGDELPKKGARVGNLADESYTKAAGYDPARRMIFRGWNDGYIYTAPVGRFDANGFGLRDMAGNVTQWCADWYADDYYSRSEVADPLGAGPGTFRVYRGSAWSYGPIDARLSLRGRAEPDDRDDSRGFRLARSQ
jgi:iron(II)-dependent oxidoreductase